jgi:hypothetical protein
MAQSQTEKMVKKKAALFHAVANDSWTVLRYQEALNEITKLTRQKTRKRLHVRLTEDQFDGRPTFEKLHFTTDPELLDSLLVAKRNEYQEYVRLVTEKIRMMDILTPEDVALLDAIDLAWDERRFGDIMNAVDAAYPSRDWQYRGSNM